MAWSPSQLFGKRINAEVQRAIEMSEEVAKWKIGQKVQKKKGYQFPGVIVAIFNTTTNKNRYVVEADSEDFKGMCHIFAEQDLKERL
jgi:heat shock protein HspQ